MRRRVPIPSRVLRVLCIAASCRFTRERKQLGSARALCQDGSAFTPSRSRRRSHIFAVLHSRFTVAGEMSMSLRPLRSSGRRVALLHDCGLPGIQRLELLQGFVQLEHVHFTRRSRGAATRDSEICRAVTPSRFRASAGAPDRLRTRRIMRAAMPKKCARFSQCTDRCGSRRKYAS